MNLAHVATSADRHNPSPITTKILPTVVANSRSADEAGRCAQDDTNYAQLDFQAALELTSCVEDDRAAMGRQSAPPAFPALQCYRGSLSHPLKNRARRFSQPSQSVVSSAGKPSEEVAG